MINLQQHIAWPGLKQAEHLESDHIFWPERVYSKYYIVLVIWRKCLFDNFSFPSTALFIFLLFLRQRQHLLFLTSLFPFFSLCLANPYICESDFIYSSQRLTNYGLPLCFLNCGKTHLLVFVNKVLLEYSHAHLLTYWQLLCYHSRTE